MRFRAGLGLHQELGPGEVYIEEDHSRVVEGLLGDCPAPRDTWRTEDGDLNMGIRDHA